MNCVIHGSGSCYALNLLLSCLTSAAAISLQGTLMHELVQYALAVAAKGPLTREALVEYVSGLCVSVCVGIVKVL